MKTTTRRPIVLLAALAAAGLTLATAACSSGGDSASFVGTWGEEADAQPSLTIEEDYSFHGTDGCNRLMGSATVSGDTIEFGAAGMTMMFCEGVDDWLNGLSTGKIVGDSLEISDESGNVIGSLARQ